MCACLGLTSACLADLDPAPDDGLGVAIYDPDTTTIPFPNDLATDIVTGRLLLTADADAPDATKEFFRVVNLIDGFFPNSEVFTTISERVDPDTVNSNNVIVVDMTDEAAPLPELTIKLDETGTKIRILPNPQWTRGHRYGVVLRGGRQGLRTLDDKQIIGDELMVFLKAREALVDVRGRPRLSPLEVVPSRQLLQMEAARAFNDQLLERLEAANVVRREDAAQVWTFKAHSRPSIVFDPATVATSLPFSRLPFPNDFIRDQTTGLVSLPAAPVDAPEALRPLLDVSRLNSLDGFSTTAAITLPLDATLKAATLVPGNLILFNTDDLTPVPFAVSQRDGNLMLQPLMPLEPGTPHLVGISDVITDELGASVTPFPMTVLLRSEYPLADGEGISLVDGLADKDAEQLERARQQFKLPVELLRLNRVTRDHIAGMFGFTTQRTTTRLQEIRKELRDAIGRDATLDDVTVTFESFAAAKAGGRIPGTQNSANIAFVATGTFKTLNYVDPATESFDDTPEVIQIRFVATYPVTVPSPRIVLLQHDFGGWRHDLLPLADQLAAAGVATLRIDAPNHGDRAQCRVNTDCTGAGTCDTTTGRCSTDFVRDADGKPTASGRGFTFGRGRMSAKELFNSRDLMRQAVVDLFQATSVARATGAGSLAAAASVAGFNTARATVQFVGSGLGGMLGTVFSSVEADVTRAVLSAAASSLLDLYFTSTALGPDLVADLAVLGIAPATPELEQFRTIAHWILDPAEPTNYARYSLAQPLDDFAIEDANGKPVQMARRELLVLKAGSDAIVPASLTDELAKVLAPNANITEGLLFKAYPGACHEFLGTTCTGSVEGRGDVINFLAGAAVTGAELR